MPLREIGALLPFHLHVDPFVIVTSVNRMVDDVAAGQVVFHDLYSAAEISARGFNAFVLTYRVGNGGTFATEDLAAALTYFTRNAAALEVATTGYSVWGSSAGARMAAAIASYEPGGDFLFPEGEAP